jgi:methylglyoxal synthase
MTTQIDGEIPRTEPAGDGAGILLAEPLSTPAGDVQRIEMTARKRIVLIAHDNRKQDLLDWAAFNRWTLAEHELFATGTTGALMGSLLDLSVERFLSGPLGGDQQVGAGIAEGRLDLVIFFWDPLLPQPHDVDVKALLRIAVVHNVPIACNRATADFLLSSPLMGGAYERIVTSFERFGS